MSDQPREHDDACLLAACVGHCSSTWKGKRALSTPNPDQADNSRYWAGKPEGQSTCLAAHGLDLGDHDRFLAGGGVQIDEELEVGSRLQAARRRAALARPCLAVARRLRRGTERLSVLTSHSSRLKICPCFHKAGTATPHLFCMVTRIHYRRSRMPILAMYRHQDLLLRSATADTELRLYKPHPEHT